MLKGYFLWLFTVFCKVYSNCLFAQAVQPFFEKEGTGTTTIV